MGKIVIQVIHPGHHMSEIRKFDMDRVRVGRGFDNDLILMDPFVSIHHVLIKFQEEGMWLVEDAGSVNGIYVYKLDDVVPQSFLSSGDEIKIGKTRLRVFSENHPVDETIALQLKDTFLKSIDNYKSLVITIIALVLIYTLEAYLGSFQEMVAGKLLIFPAFILVYSLIWASVWAFIGHLIRRKASWKLHMTLVCFFNILWVPVNNVSSLLGYLTSQIGVEIFIAVVSMMVLFSLLLIGHLAVSTNLSLRARVIASNSINAIILVISLLIYLATKDTFRADPIIYGTLKPPLVKIIPSQSIDGFIAQTSDVFTVAAQKVKKDAKE